MAKHRKLGGGIYDVSGTKPETEGRGARESLDRLVAHMAEPGFAIRFRRVPPSTERPGHVSPTILAASSRRSKYVRQWRRHARRCNDCANVFRYFGLSID
jgi:uncharacterized membrane protein